MCLSINKIPHPLPATGARGHRHLPLLFSSSQHTSPNGNGHGRADLPQVSASKGPVVSYSPIKSREMAGTASEPTWAAAQLLSSKINFGASAKLGICVRFCMTTTTKKRFENNSSLQLRCRNPQPLLSDLTRPCSSTGEEPNELTFQHFLFPSSTNTQLLRKSSDALT